MSGPGRKLLVRLAAQIEGSSHSMKTIHAIPAGRQAATPQVMSASASLIFSSISHDGVAVEYGMRHHRVAGSDRTRPPSYLPMSCRSLDRTPVSLPRTFKPEEWLAAFRSRVASLITLRRHSRFFAHPRRQCTASHRLSMGPPLWTDKLGLSRSVVTWSPRKKAEAHYRITSSLYHRKHISLC